MEIQINIIKKLSLIIILNVAYFLEYANLRKTSLKQTAS